ncbi:MAG: ABC transporter permease [Gemmatimonadales bacterium]
MRRRSEILLTVLLLWAVAYPISLVFLESLRDAGAGAGTGAWSLVHLADFAGEPSEWRALWNSLWISAVSVVLSAAVGIPLGFVFELFEFPGRKVLGALVALPVVLPPLVGVIAFLFLYGESGFVPRMVQGALALDDAPWRLTGAPAILLVHTYSMSVFFYLFTRAGLAKLDASMIEAAHSLGVRGFGVVRRVTLPLLRPQLAAAGLLVFMTSLGSFSAPFLFGGNFRVMTTQIYASKLNGNFGASMVETSALAIIALFGLFLLRRMQGERSVVAVGKGVTHAPKLITRPAARVLASLSGWVLALVLLLPHLTLMLISLVPRGTWTNQIVPPVYSFVNYVSLITQPERFRPMFNSLWMAALSTVLVIGIAVWAGRQIVQRKARWQRGIETLLHVPWAIPGTVLAISLATVFSVNAPWFGRLVLVGTAAILPFAYVVRNIPVASGSIVAGFRQLDPSLEEAAGSLGAGRWRTLRRITMPLLRPAILAGGALAFATAVGDFVTSIILYTFETRPISIEILAMLRQNDLGVAAAYGVFLMVISTAAMAAGTKR